MKDRCYNPKNKEFDRYGGRGITICDEWRYSYDSFREWALLNGYNELAKHSECTLDRVNVDLGYCPVNCRWANAKVQARNRTNTLYISYDGKTLSLSEWADILGIKYHTLFARIYKLGWSVDRAFH